MHPTLVIVTGLPCTGKTTLGKSIADYFKLPFLSKDEIKELIFDTIGYDDREYSKKIGKVAYAILFNYANELLKKGVSIILESNFKPEFDNEFFKKIEENYQPKIIQVLCFSDGEVLINRFKDRAENGNRHPGHVDATNLDEWRSALSAGKCHPIAVGGKLIEINTTNFSLVNTDEIVRFIELERNHRSK